MKIKDFRKSVSHNFGDIEPGTVFAIGDRICMAIELIEEKESDVFLNAVDLETGELTYYFDTDFIQPVEAELCVR